MILTDREIEIAITNRHIIVEPAPVFAEALSSTTLDLTLSNTFVEWNPMAGITVHPGASEYSYKNLLPMQNKIAAQSYTLPPQGFVLAWTRE